MADLDALLKRLDTLDERLSTVEVERDHYRELYQQMLERCRKLERGLLAQKSERLGDDGAQLSLEVLDLVLGERAKAEIDALEDEQVVKAHKRKPPTGRKPIPEHLPRVVTMAPDTVTTAVQAGAEGAAGAAGVSDP